MRGAGVIAVGPISAAPLTGPRAFVGSICAGEASCSTAS
jgi:hypothetical protein